MHAVRKIEELRGADPALNEDVVSLLHALED
jgi:hypothetical protein